VPRDGSYPSRGRPQPPPPAASQWARRDVGPVVRPYAVTGGRTEPADGEVLDVVAVVLALPGGEADEDDPLRRTPEHRRILAMCQRQATVADIAAGTALPLGVVRVLLSDLIMSGGVRVIRQLPAGQRPDNNVLQEILNGLRAL
jgi:hypothetical protein